MQNSLKLFRVQKLFFNAYELVQNKTLWPSHLNIALTHYVHGIILYERFRILITVVDILLNQ